MEREAESEEGRGGGEGKGGMKYKVVSEGWREGRGGRLGSKGVKGGGSAGVYGTICLIYILLQPSNLIKN